MVHMSYEKAKVNCATKFLNSGKLFEPLSQQVNDLVWEEFKGTIVSNRYGAWIGVNDQETHSVFKYTSSGSDVSFTIQWLPGYESITSRNECIMLWKGGKWREILCTSSQVSICEHINQ